MHVKGEIHILFLQVAASNVIFLIRDVFYPSTSHPLLIRIMIFMTFSAGTHSSSPPPPPLPPPQLSIPEFAHMQSNRVVDGTEDWEMVEIAGPVAKDHILVPQRR